MDTNVSQASTRIHEEEQPIVSETERIEAREAFRRAYVARIREQAARLPKAKPALFMTSAPIFGMPRKRTDEER